MAGQRDVVTLEPRGVIGTLDELLRRPMAGTERAESGASVLAWTGRVLAGSVACSALYGGASGFFQGGTQVAIAAAKAPAIVLGAAALCVPSLYVFSLLAGASLTRERLAVVLAGFLGLVALVLVGLLPIEWLFSVSSSSLPFVVWLNLILWGMALFFGGRFLHVALPEVPLGAVVLWLVLFCVVSFQVTTFMRPVLWRAPGAPVVERGKLFFLDHYSNVNKKTAPDQE
jgi:hypothetical protein